ncbi:hypothetical protein SH661x_004101 [Planctomicrobium sp. SH661]|uniref:hypothetical protein n=1 Tax=Planctomicrobium sp. SH661 TaxID=3448124 RepID=UPI003F5C11A5
MPFDLRGTIEKFQPQEADVERKRFPTIIGLLMLTLLVGCETIRPLNPLSKSHGLPPQTESDSGD